MQPATMLPKLTDTTQTISFSEGDGICSAEVFASEVVISTSAGAHNHGSSKVKLKSLVDYNWESKYYSGQLLAIHMSGNYLAYSIKAPNTVNPGTWSGMVRVVYSAEPGTDRRALIKGMKGEVHDLSFAHIENTVVLACIDEQGNFYVHDIELTDSGLRCSLLAEVREDTNVGSGSHRVVWCPYIPDADDDAPDEDVARLLLTTHASTARMWNIRQVTSQLAAAGGERRALASALLNGRGALAASEHGAPVVDAAFSPDGTALATASADGYVMFFQVYMHNEATPRCLHKWQPHGGKPLSCLFFLDNHKNYNSDVQFWKFAVTGAENNTTLKIWSCKSWSCLQTITFSPGLCPEPPTLGLKAMLDTSASYLLLSDSKARSLYVLHMARDRDDTMAYCKSISEFLLPYPVLSFCIVDAGEQQGGCESSCGDPYHRNGLASDVAPSPEDFDLMPQEEEVPTEGCAGNGARRVRLRLYIVQPKGLQQGELAFAPPPAPADPLQVSLSGLADLSLGDEAQDSAPAPMASSILQQQSQQLKNLLMRSQTQPGSLIGQRAESPSAIPPPLNLMTPDAFSSPGKREEDDPPLSATPEVSGKARTSTTGFATEEPVMDPKFTSNGSSPSREVQQIMSLNDELYYKEMIDEASQSPAAEEAEEALPAATQNGADPIYDDGELFASPEQPPPAAHKLTHSHSSNDWPQISLAQINEANQRKASSDKSSSQSLNNSLSVCAEPERVERARSNALAPDDRAKLDALDRKLDQLTELLTVQSREIRTLRSSLQSPRDLIEQALHAHTQRTTQAVESALSEGWERITRSSEALGGRAAAAAGVGAARALEPLAHALQHELAAKLTATDHLLRENIDKLANSKTVMERLSTSIAASLADMVRASFREALAQSALPAMEKAHQQMFRQLNHAFQQGAKEFASHTENAARAAAERGGASAATALRTALERHGEALAQAQTPPHHHQLTAALRDATRAVLEKEMGWWREQARGVVAEMSRAHSPATPATPHSQHDRQMQVAQIQSMMGSGDVNGAFQLALSASDLSLVVGACRAADPGAVFAPPCRLKQHVLLSLVQQLSADMGHDTQLKHRYLEEAIMNLDTSNPVTREHLPAVVRELHKHIMAFLSTSPAHPQARQFKVLLMAAESLVKGGV